jgi:hypothetical protein
MRFNQQRLHDVWCTCAHACLDRLEPRTYISACTCEQRSRALRAKQMFSALIHDMLHVQGSLSYNSTTSTSSSSPRPSPTGSSEAPPSASPRVSVHQSLSLRACSFSAIPYSTGGPLTSSLTSLCDILLAQTGFSPSLPPAPPLAVALLCSANRHTHHALESVDNKYG